MLRYEFDVVVGDDLNAIDTVSGSCVEHQDVSRCKVTCWNNDRFAKDGNLALIGIVLVNLNVERTCVSPGYRRLDTVDFQSALRTWSNRRLPVARLPAQYFRAIRCGFHLDRVAVNDFTRLGRHHLLTLHNSVLEAQIRWDGQPDEALSLQWNRHLQTENPDGVLCDLENGRGDR